MRLSFCRITSKYDFFRLKFFNRDKRPKDLMMVCLKAK